MISPDNRGSRDAVRVSCRPAWRQAGAKTVAISLATRTAGEKVAASLKRDQHRAINKNIASEAGSPVRDLVRAGNVGVDIPRARESPPRDILITAKEKHTLIERCFSRDRPSGDLDSSPT